MRKHFKEDEKIAEEAKVGSQEGVDQAEVEEEEKVYETP